MNDPELVPPLIEITKDGKGSPRARATAILALGRFGDHNALAPLIVILENAKAPDRERALAAAALGILGGRRGRSPLARIAKDINDLALVDPIAAVLEIL